MAADQLAVLHLVDAADAHGLHHGLGCIAHARIDRAGHAGQRAVTQRCHGHSGAGVEIHHGGIGRAALDHAQVQPPGLARALGGFGGVEGLHLHILEHGRQCWQGGQHLLRGGWVCAVDMHHGDMGQVEGIGLLRELELVQLGIDDGRDLAVHDDHGIGRQAVDQTVSGVVGAELGAAQRAVVNLAAAGGSGGWRGAAGAQSQCQGQCRGQGNPGWSVHETRL